MTREKLGSIWTDVATLLIGDPCQLIPGKGEPPEITYEQLMEILHPDNPGQHAEFDAIAARIDAETDKTRKLELVRKLGDNLRGSRDNHIKNYESRLIPPNKGLIVSVECDGYYPVYLVRNAKGEPVRLEIELGGKSTA